MTRQKTVILDVIRSDKCHHTAEEIYFLAKDLLPSISKATVYNNLKALVDERIIRKISGDDGPDRYDSSYIPHGHLICTECGGVFDIDLPCIETIITDRIGMIPESYELKVRAVCSACRQRAYKRTL